MKQVKKQPQPVKRYFCPKCKELMCKIYPWSSLQVNGGLDPCFKCLNDSLKNSSLKI